jgi:hypothetical protein
LIKKRKWQNSQTGETIDLILFLMARLLPWEDAAMVVVF